MGKAKDTNNHNEWKFVYDAQGWFFSPKKKVGKALWRKERYRKEVLFRWKGKHIGLPLEGVKI